MEQPIINSTSKKKPDINSNYSVDDTPVSSSFIKQLLNVCACEVGDSGITFPNLDFSWADPNRIKAGQTFIRKYLHSILLSMIFGAFCGSCIPSILSVTSRTGQFYTKKRHLRTVMAFLNCIQGIELDDNLRVKLGPAVKNLIKIRKIHIGIAKRMEAGKMPEIPKMPDLDEEHRKLIYAIQNDIPSFTDTKTSAQATVLSYNPPVPLSQLDMLLELYSICGLVVAHPEKFGVQSQDINSPGFEGYVQILGILTQIIGISDPWNIFHSHHPLCGQSACQTVLKELYMQINGSISPRELASVIQVVSPYWPLSSLFSPRMHGIYYSTGKYIFDLDCLSLQESMNWFDKIFSGIILSLLKWNQSNSFYISNILHSFSTGLIWLLRKT